MTNTTQTMTNGSAREGAMWLDLLDAEPVTRLWEDEAPVDRGESVEWGHEGDEDEDWFWGLSVHNEG